MFCYSVSGGFLYSVLCPCRLPCSQEDSSSSLKILSVQASWFLSSGICNIRSTTCATLHIAKTASENSMFRSSIQVSIRSPLSLLTFLTISTFLILSFSSLIWLYMTHTYDSYPGEGTTSGPPTCLAAVRTVDNVTRFNSIEWRRAKTSAIDRSQHVI